MGGTTKSKTNNKKDKQTPLTGCSYSAFTVEELCLTIVAYNLQPSRKERHLTCTFFQCCLPRCLSELWSLKYRNLETISLFSLFFKKMMIPEFPFSHSLPSPDCFLLTLCTLISPIYSCALYFILSASPHQETFQDGLFVSWVFNQLRVSHVKPAPSK